MLPTFLIIGAQKAGTTWLARMLRQHPDVYMPPRELHFFDKRDNYRKGLAWYEQHFREATHHCAVGEKTPDYLWANGNGIEGHLSDVHLNIHRAVPSAKLIISLRNPVDRAVSAVKHIIGSGRISPLHRIDDLLTGKERQLVEGHGVIDYGFYYRQLKAYLEYFDRQQLLVLIYEEDIVGAPAEGLAKVCDFLGIDGSFPFRRIRDRVNAHHHSLVSLLVSYHAPVLRPLSKRIGRHLPKYDPRPSREVRDTLHRIYEQENDKLADLLQRGPIATWQSRS